MKILDMKYRKSFGLVKVTFFVLTLFLSAAPLTKLAYAAESGVTLDKANNDLSDKASLQRGATLFINYCAACHQMQYQRFNRVAKDLGISEELMTDNLMFDQNHKITDLMTNALTDEDGAAFFGIAVPDLTLNARLRGSDWIYTYLRSFYADPKRPFGVNNLLIPNVAMPHVLEGLQGIPVQEVIKRVETTKDNTNILVEAKAGITVVGKAGMSSEEYDGAVRDIVNFLEYSSEPIKLERQSMGWWVLGYLFILLILTYLLKKAFWRSVK